jgi:hypothetical protein
MRYEEKIYYKIGKTRDLGKRELALKTANPFLDMIGIKTTFNYDKEEKEIHHKLKQYHFDGEWYELPDDVFQNTFINYNFEIYTETERLKNIKNAYIKIKERIKQDPQSYRVFKKNKTIGGRRTYRWYYWYCDTNGKQVQETYRNCKKNQML